MLQIRKRGLILNNHISVLYYLKNITIYINNVPFIPRMITIITIFTSILMDDKIVFALS